MNLMNGAMVFSVALLALFFLLAGSSAQVSGQAAQSGAEILLQEQDSGINFVLINPKSEPLVDGEWGIFFTVEGVADLEIEPLSPTDWEQVEFASLSCGNQAVSGEWAGDALKVNGYSCNETGKLAVTPKTFGRHFMRLKFGGIEVVAANTAVWSTAVVTEEYNIIDQRVSCTSGNFCMLVEEKWVDPNPHYAMYKTWDGSSWTSAQNIPGAGAGTNSNTEDVDCVSPSFCMEIDNFYNLNYSTWDGSSWTASSQIRTGIYGDLELDCPSSDFCMAAYSTSANAVDYSVWQSGAWTTGSIDSTGTNGYPRVSCMDKSECYAFWSDSGASNALYYSTWTGSSWSAPAAFQSKTITGMPDVDCIPGFCMMVFKLSDESAFQYSTIEKYTNWTITTPYVSSNADGHYNDIVAADRNTAFAAYYDWSASDLRFSKTTDGSKTWTNTAIDTANNVGYNPSIDALGASKIYVSYVDATNYDLKLAKSTNGGSTWSISTIDENALYGYQTSIDAVDANTIFIGFFDNGNGYATVARTTDGGTNWTFSHVGVGTDYDISLDAVDANTVYISYGRGSTLEVAKSTNGGATWTRYVPYGGASIYKTSIEALDANTAYAAYRYAGTYSSVMFTKTTNGGATWSTSIVDSGSIDYGDPSMDAVDRNLIYISYNDQTNYQLRLAKSTDGGATWTKSSITSAPNSYPGYDTDVSAVNEDVLYVSYFKNPDYDIGVARSLTGGTVSSSSGTWSTAASISGTGSPSYQGGMGAPTSCPRRDSCVFQWSTTGTGTTYEKYAHWDGSSWVVGTISSYSPSFNDDLSAADNLAISLFGTDTSSSHRDKWSRGYIGGCTPPDTGDWYIAETCTINSQNIAVGGNIYIYSGGILDMTGTTNINLLGSYIYVYQGGEIRISNTAGFNK